MPSLQWNTASANPCIAIRGRAIALMPVLLLTATMPTPAAATKAQVQCGRTYNSCNDGCRSRFTSPDLLTSCYNRCTSAFDKCLKAAGVGKKETDPDATPPKGTVDHTSPTGGVNSSAH
jgi:hypothetical protein